MGGRRGRENWGVELVGREEEGGDLEEGGDGGGVPDIN